MCGAEAIEVSAAMRSATFSNDVLASSVDGGLSN
jgi:hypothetical protein